MCKENPLWGAPRIHGELLKLGFDVAQSTVSKYMLRRRGPPSQGWKTFLRNHADGIASVDFVIVPTLAFQRLFVFVILGLGRRRLLWIGVTTNPTADCMDWRHMSEVLKAGGVTYSELKNLCVWVKDNGGMGTFYRFERAARLS